MTSRPIASQARVLPGRADVASDTDRLTWGRTMSSARSVPRADFASGLDNSPFFAA
jgi:hypothetical protein